MSISRERLIWGLMALLARRRDDPRKVNGPTRTTRPWGTQIRLRAFRPGHPQLLAEVRLGEAR
jgi:hypothetical protein